MRLTQSTAHFDTADVLHMALTVAPALIFCLLASGAAVGIVSDEKDMVAVGAE